MSKARFFGKTQCLRMTIGVVFLFFTGCAVVQKPTPPLPLPPPPSVSLPALIPVSPDAWPVMVDDGDIQSLKQAAERSASFYRTFPAGTSFRVGNDSYTAAEFAETLDTFVAIASSATPGTNWAALLRENFSLYQSSGVSSDHRVTFSSYYEPTIEARLKPDAVYRFPIYGRPDDLIDVDLGLFDPAYQGARISGRRQGNRLVPYYSRAQIDSGNQLKGQSLERAWAKDPMEILFLQIEGSGWLDLGEGQRTRIRFDGTNGLKFRSVGQNLINTGRIPKAEFNRQRFEEYMREHPKERQALLNVNERYVFFQVDRGATQQHAYGNIRVPLTPWRSIATDPKLFPKGGLAWISVKEKTQRFVLNQDEGGAIQGPGRVDYFVGGGAEAEKFAWSMWDPGTLYFLIKKRSASQISPAP